jgi:hypothetical protein
MGGAKRYQEELDERGFGETGGRSVCLDCINDSALKRRVTSNVTESECSFCGASSDSGDQPIAIPFEDLMYIVMEAVYFLFEGAEGSVYYDRTEDQWYGIVYSAEDVAYHICGGSLADDVVIAVGEVITNQVWTDVTAGFLPPDRALQAGWKDFCSLVKERCRFVFLSRYEKPVDEPDSYTTVDFLAKLDSIIVEHNLIDDVPVGHTYWRGRLSSNRDDVRDWSNAAKLGPPPHHLASTNRMSPAGISMFYGSENIDTVIAEIGAHKARPYAIVGQFFTVRPLRMLNLAKLPPIPSLFEESGRTSGYFDLAFMRGFTEDIAKPIVLDGREHIEYVPTQVVTEYLRYISACAVDGILFRSAQDGKVNCVVFCDSEECRDRGSVSVSMFSSTPTLELEPSTVRAIEVKLPIL